jgi:hypothetical protein
LSFAKQLALSEPGDWRSVAVFGDGKSLQLAKVYLRLEGKAWWSFRGVIDRPSAGAVQNVSRRPRSRVVAGESLQGLANRPFSAEARALTRAILAIRARTGTSTSTKLENERQHG